MAILVTGVNGQLGGALARHLGARCIACDEGVLDITDSRRVHEVIRDRQPKAVINCAAFTQVDQAESHAELCMATNATAVIALADACRRQDAVLVQISTDYVFGGDRQRKTPYTELDSAAPLNIYGQSKLAGEQFAARWEKHIVIRTCGLYGVATRSTNFVEKIVGLAQTRDRLRVVNDQCCSPTYVEHLVRAVLFLLEQSAYGLYHVVNRDSATWYDFTREILRQCGIATPVDPIPTAEFAAAADRPHYSVLDTRKYHATGGPVMSGWREALAEYLAQRALVGRGIAE